MDKKEKFKNDLKALLQKYDASIGFNCSACSDRYGIHDAKIEAVFVGDDKDDFVILSRGWSVDHHDI